MVHIIVRNYKILPIISTPPMFAAEIERGHVARADDCCLRQARPEVQRITPPPMFVVESARPLPPELQNPTLPQDVSTRPSPIQPKSERTEPTGAACLQARPSGGGAAASLSTAFLGSRIRH